MFVNKNDLTDVTPLKNCNLDIKFLDRLSFLLKMGLEFFSAGLEFF